MRGDALLSPAVTRRLISEFVSRPPAAAAAAGMETLTNRERGVVAPVAHGLSNDHGLRDSKSPLRARLLVVLGHMAVIPATRRRSESEPYRKATPAVAAARVWGACPASGDRSTAQVFRHSLQTSVRGCLCLRLTRGPLPSRVRGKTLVVHSSLPLRQECSVTAPARRSVAPTSARRTTSDIHPLGSRVLTMSGPAWRSRMTTACKRN
jgi:hypothetical protein